MSQERDYCQTKDNQVVWGDGLKEFPHMWRDLKAFCVLCKKEKGLTPI